MVHKRLPILLNAFDSVLLYYRTVKRLLIPFLQIRVRNRKLVCYFSNKTYVVGTQMGLLNETKSTIFNLLIRETSQCLCYERLLNMTYVAYKNAFCREMQFWSHCYTVVSYQALFRLSVYKIPAVYLSGAKNMCFCTIRDFGSRLLACMTLEGKVMFQRENSTSIPGDIFFILFLFMNNINTTKTLIS